MVKKIVASCLFCLFFLIGEGFAQSYPHMAALRIESAELCPGQEADLAVYVDLFLGNGMQGGTGCYTADQQPPAPLDNFMFYLAVSDTSKIEVVTSYKEDRGGYYMGRPVLSDVHPELSGGSFTYNYVYGWDQLGNYGVNPEGAVFTCIWVKNGITATFLPKNNQPLFRIRVRCKEQGEASLKFLPSTLAFSTGLTYLGGYYYTFENEKAGCSNIHNSAITNGKGPQDVSAGKDSLICVRDRVVFNAEGGKSYSWKLLSNRTDYLSNHNTKNPTFFPLEPGTYTYQVQAADEQGCVSFAKVNYLVSQNYINQVISPDDIMVDSGSRVTFDLSASTLKPQGNVSSLKPIRLTVMPDSIFPPGGNVLYSDSDKVSGQLTTLPITEPVLVTVTAQDTVCSAQKSANVHVRGVKVKGKITPFPVYRCGNDLEDKRLQLNVTTTGGSGKFLYNWKVTDLEFGDLGDPWLNNRTSRAPMLWYVGLCAVSVDIYDMETGETVTISDTMIHRDWLHADAEVVLDTAASMLADATEIGPFCETAELTYKVRSSYAGTDARYIWEVNGVWREEGINDTTFSTVLRRGDSVSCVLYSTEACVAEEVVQSNRFAPEIRYPSLAELRLGFETAPEYDAENCDEDISLAATLFSAGHNFRLQWLRNGEVVAEDRPYCENIDSAGMVRHFSSGSYFDAYSVLLTESDMPCRAFDSVYSQSEDSVYEKLHHGLDLTVCPPEGVTKNYLYPRRNPSAPVVAGPIEMVGEMAVCEGETFTLRAKVENVPENFILKWFLKQGKDSALLGYYNYQGPSYDPFLYPQEYLPGNYNLRGGTGYGYSNCESGILRAFSDGFKIILNDPEAFVAERDKGYVKSGDTVFYVLYSTSEVCGRMPHAARSPYFVPQQIPAGSMTPPLITYQEQIKICPTASATLVASCASDAFVSYKWYLYNTPVTDTPTEYYKYFTVSGTNQDTLFIHRVWPDFLIRCEATVEYGCNKGKTLTGFFKFDSIVKEASSMFGIVRSMDTIICENAQVHLMAEVKEYAEPGVPEKTKSSRVLRREKQKIAKNYTISWSINDLEALKNGGADVIEDSELRDTPQSNGNQPKGIGDWDDTKGLTVYYIKAEQKASGCEVYDSIWVLMAHPYQVKATIDYVLPSPWCDSSFTLTDPGRKVEGQPYHPGGQYAVLNIENGGAHPIWKWGLNQEWIENYMVDTVDMLGAPSGDTLKAWVKTDMYTCLPDTALATPRLIQSTVGIDEVFAIGPDWASGGDRIMLVAEGGVLMDPVQDFYDEVGNYDYTWSVQQLDGSWTELGQGSAAGRKMVDTFYTVMPAREAVFKVEATDRHEACPTKSQLVKVALSVNTDVDLKAFDPVSGKEIAGFCAQSNALAIKDGTNLQGNISWVETDGRQSAKVLLRAYPENAGGSAYVGYYKNGDLVAVGSVGTEDFLMEDATDSDYRKLTRGDTMTLEIMPGDWVGAFYVNDTVSADGHSTHYSPRLTFGEVAPADGLLQVTSDRTALCAGMKTGLHAAFESGYEGVAPTWSPVGSLTDGGRGWTVTATPTLNTTYTAVAYDHVGCAWKDSVRVNIVSGSQTLPLALEADALRFCGRETEMNLRIDPHVSNAEDFTEFYWYVLEAGASRLAATTQEASVSLSVTGGMQVFAQAKAMLTCQTGLSVSDTLQFEGVDRPVLRRLQPLSDTTVCPGSTVRVGYEVKPQDAVIAWYSLFDNTVIEVEGETEPWIEGEVPDDIVLRIEARIADLLDCTTQAEVAVKVFDADSALPVVRVEPETEAVCGARQIRYTAECDRCDSLIWFANGREVLRNENTLLWTPRQTGLNGVADSIVVAGVRRATMCVPMLRTESAPVLVYRIDKPDLLLLCGDTTVQESAPVRLAASATAFGGDAVDIYWLDGGYNTVAEAAMVELEMRKSDIFYALARHKELADDLLPECFSLDSVWVRVVDTTAPIRDTVFIDDVYVPNTIVPSSSRSADRYLKVYGVDLKEVVMKVYDARGIPVYEHQGVPAQVYWDATDLNGNLVEAGMYAYWVRVLTATGKLVEKRGWVNVVR